MVKSPTVRILLYLLDNESCRHTDLSKVIKSRGTLAYSLDELMEEELVKREIVDTKPIESYYTLTEKGKTIAAKLKEIKNTLKK